MVGKILGEKTELRSRVKELSGVINTVVGEVNNLSLSEQKAIVEKNWPETQKKHEAEEKKLRPYQTPTNTNKSLPASPPTPTACCTWGLPVP